MTTKTNEKVSRHNNPVREVKKKTSPQFSVTLRLKGPVAKSKAKRNKPDVFTQNKQQSIHTNKNALIQSPVIKGNKSPNAR